MQAEDAAAALASWGGQGGAGLFDAAAVRVLVGGGGRLSLSLSRESDTLYIYTSRERLYLCDYIYVYRWGCLWGGPVVTRLRLTPGRSRGRPSTTTSSPQP